MVFSFLKKNKRLSSRDLAVGSPEDPCSSGQYKRRRSPNGREVEADPGGGPSSTEPSPLKFTDWESSNPVITFEINSGLNLTSDTLKRLRRRSSQQALNKCGQELSQSTLSIAPLKARGRPRPESFHLGRSLTSSLSIPSLLHLPGLSSASHAVSHCLYISCAWGGH